MAENYFWPKSSKEEQKGPPPPEIGFMTVRKEIKFFLAPENQHFLVETARQINKFDQDWKWLGQDMVKLRGGHDFLVNVLATAIINKCHFSPSQAEYVKQTIERNISHIIKEFFSVSFLLTLMARHHPDAAGHDFSKAQQTDLFPNLQTGVKPPKESVGGKGGKVVRGGPRRIDSPRYPDKNFNTFLERSQPKSDRSD